jgi:hypothetical protein
MGRKREGKMKKNKKKKRVMVKDVWRKRKNGIREIRRLHAPYITHTALALAYSQLSVGVGWRGRVERDVRSAGRVG